MALTSNLWSPNKALNNLVSVSLFLFIALSLLIFYKSETTFFTLLVIILTLMAVGNKKHDDAKSLVSMTAFLAIHTAFFVYFNTSLNIYSTSILLAITVLGAIHNTSDKKLESFTYLVLAFTVIGAYLIASFLPASILVLTLLAALPLMVLLPILSEDGQSLPKQLMHATVTGIMGAGLITASAILFI